MNDNPVPKSTHHHYAGFYSDQIFAKSLPDQVSICDKVYDVNHTLTYSVCYDGQQLHAALVPFVVSETLIPTASIVTSLVGDPITYVCGSHDNQYPLVTYAYSSIKVTCNGYSLRKKTKPMAYGPFQFDNKESLVNFIKLSKPLEFKNALTCWIKPNNHLQISLTDENIEVFNLHLG